MGSSSTARRFGSPISSPPTARTGRVLERFGKNRLTVTRQVPCHPSDRRALDLVAVGERPAGGDDRIEEPRHGPDPGGTRCGQYQEDRDPRAPLFEFKKRALVHFARGHRRGPHGHPAGGRADAFPAVQPGQPSGRDRLRRGQSRARLRATGRGYFWEDVLRVDSFLDILGRFLFIEKRDEKQEDGRGGQRIVTRETMVFPRFHQLDAVRKLIEGGAGRGAGPQLPDPATRRRERARPTAFPGLSHRLASLHDAKDAKVFDCVVVVTDRQVLDRQLQDAIYQIEHAQGVVKAIDQDSRQLAAALIDGTKIVVTTLQKFPFVLRGLLHAAGAGSPEEASPEQTAEAERWEAGESRGGAMPSSWTRRIPARAARRPAN